MCAATINPRITLLVTSLALATALLLAACSPQDAPETNMTEPPPPASPVEPPEAPTQPSALAGTAWGVVQIDGRATLPDAQSTLEFLEDGKVAGRGGCNRYGGPVDIGAGAMRFGALFSTKMACPGGAMEQEQRFFQALEATRSYQITGNALVLVDEAGAERVRLTAQADEPVT